MPPIYERIRDSLVKKGTKLKDAKARAARMYNTKKASLLRRKKPMNG